MKLRSFTCIIWCVSRSSYPGGGKIFHACPDRSRGPL